MAETAVVKQAPREVIATLDVARGRPVEAILVVTCAPPRGNYSGPVKEIVSRYVTEQGALDDLVKYEIDKPRWVAEVEVFTLRRRWRNPEVAR